MSEKQKEAIKILNNLVARKDPEGNDIMTTEQYFTLLEFVVEEQQQVLYVPEPWPTPPGIQPYYGQRFEITCKSNQGHV